ncbi:hypothetical protein [Streptomyces mirabilis]|uniref:hypothetical protein n=1 Tax=Streptomyces mirabilis TaxID=68239 RepID=UPI003665E3A4
MAGRRRLSWRGGRANRLDLVEAGLSGTQIGRHPTTPKPCLTEDLTETELLAGLLVVRALRDKLLEDEARLIAAARRRKITWVRIGHALEVRSRQAAERRFLQLRTDIDGLHGSPLTQHERVSYARDQHERHADVATAIASLRQQAEDDAVKTQTLPTSHFMD